MGRALAPITLTSSTRTIDLGGLQLTRPTELKLVNESPYALRVTLPTLEDWLAPWTADVFCLSGANSVTIAPALIASTPLGSSASWQLLASVADQGESFPGTFPASLTRIALGQAYVPTDLVLLVIDQIMAANTDYALITAQASPAQTLTVISLIANLLTVAITDQPRLKILTTDGLTEWSLSLATSSPQPWGLNGWTLPAGVGLKMRTVSTQTPRVLVSVAYTGHT